MRTKWTDPDFRKHRATRDMATMCVVCAKELKANAPRRHVIITTDCPQHPHPFMAVHVDDWCLATGDTFERGIIGIDCAKRLGLEWSSLICPNK